MKVKVTGLIMCIMMFCVCILSGCNLVTTDRYTFLNTQVASFTDKDTKVKTKVIKKDLITAYNTYGYYYEQSGMSKKEALEATLELLVNRKIMLVEAEKAFPEGLNEKEKAYLWQTTLSGLESNFQIYYNEVAGITGGNDSSTSEERVFKGYTKNAQLSKVNGEFEIVKTNVSNKLLDDFDFDPEHAYDVEKAEDKRLMYDNFLSVINSASAGENYRKAYNEYLKALKASEEGLKLSIKADEVFLREIDRIYNINYENYMITKYEESYRNYNELSNISVQDILNSYSSLVRASYAQYNLEESASYVQNMQSDSTKIYYYRDGKDDTQFFQVAHVLFKFTDEQANEYKALKAQYGKDGNGAITDKDVYEQKINELVSQIKPVVREKNEAGEYKETDVKAEYEKTAYELARYIKNQVNGKTDTQDKVDTFREFIYKYNDDPGMINASNNYTIGVNKSEAEGDDEYKIYSNFVEEFNDAAVELYNRGNGKVGDISEPILSENGIHVLFYVGEIENLFGNINENFALSNDERFDGLSPIEVLNNTRVNIFVDQTYFDIVYDGLISDRFSSFQTLHINDLRSKYSITHYKSNYDDLAKK